MFYFLHSLSPGQRMAALEDLTETYPKDLFRFSGKRGSVYTMTAETLKEMLSRNEALSRIRDHASRMTDMYPLEYGDGLLAVAPDIRLGFSGFWKQLRILLDLLLDPEPVDPDSLPWNSVKEPMTRFFDHTPDRNPYTDFLHPFLTALFTPSEDLRAYATLKDFYELCQTEALRPEPKYLKIETNPERIFLVRSWTYTLGMFGYALLDFAGQIPHPEVPGLPTRMEGNGTALKYRYGDLVSLYIRGVKGTPPSWEYVRREEDITWKKLELQYFENH